MRKIGIVDSLLLFLSMLGFVGLSATHTVTTATSTACGIVQEVKKCEMKKVGQARDTKYQKRHRTDGGMDAHPS